MGKLILPRRKLLIGGAASLICAPSIVRAACSLPLCGAGPSAPGAAVSTTTWNPADCNANLTLSGGNRIATMNNAVNNFYSVRSIASHSTGKYYYEITCNTLTNPSGTTVGFANSTWPLTDFGGQDNNSVGWYGLGNLFPGGPSIATYTTGSLLGVAIDFGNQKFWGRLNGGLWNLSGTDDPATNTGGFSFASLNAGPYFAGITLGHCV